jgi:hypothetical protein
VSDDRDTGVGLWPRLAKLFFGLDLRSLALFRIALALILLVDLADRAQDLTAHYTDDGVLPRSITPIFIPVSLHALSGSLGAERLLFVLAAVIAVLLLVGYRTQLATLLSWVLLLSLHARNPLVLHGGDLMLRVLLFWCIFLPMGACWSLDARHRVEGKTPVVRPLVCSVATAALTLQVVFVYWFGLASRTDSSWWGDATAVPIALHLDFYATPLGLWVRNLPPELLRAATVATVTLEGGGPLLLLLSGGLPRLRILVVALMIAFHVLLGLSMRLGIFPLICVAAWLPFLPAWFWDVLRRRRASAAALVPTATAGQLSPLTTAVVLLCFAAICVSNVQWLHGGFILTQVKGIGIDQTWGMFAPRPSDEDGWYVVELQLRNGSRVDAFRGGPVVWDKPERISSSYPSMRWAAYLSMLKRTGNELNRPYFADYLLRHWNKNYSGDEMAESVEVYYMLRYLRPDYTATDPQKHLMVKVTRDDSSPRP